MTLRRSTVVYAGAKKYDGLVSAVFPFYDWPDDTDYFFLLLINRNDVQ
jgi:hypothetical protein